MGSEKNEKLASLVAGARVASGMHQEELAEQVGKSRQWVVQLENGYRYDTGKTFVLDARSAMMLAQVLDLDPHDVLVAGEVPKSKWPKVSYMRSNNANIRTINITGLTEEQEEMISRLVKELRGLNNERTNRKSPRKPL